MRRDGAKKREFTPKSGNVDIYGLPQRAASKCDVQMMKDLSPVLQKIYLSLSTHE